MRKSYLLLVDGSQESLAAVRVCQQLSEKSGAQVTALSVIDTSSARNLVRIGRPGLVGSGPYVAAYQQVLAALRELAETIMLSYRSKFSALANNPDQCLIEEGDPLQVIRRFYIDHDLIIMGRRNGSDNLHSEQSLSQAIAMDGALPVLVVREDEACQYSSMRLIGSETAPSEACLDSVLGLAYTTDMRTKFSYFGSSEQFTRWAELVSDRIPSNASSVVFTNVQPADLDWHPHVPMSKDSLPVFFTRKAAVGRTTIANEDVRSLLMDMMTPAALLWPMEFAEVA